MKLEHVDPLTGIGNRYRLNTIFERELVSLKRGSISDFALLYLDVDNFGGFNWRFGTADGDEMLKHIAKTANSSLRPSEICRWGGDEFIAVLSDADLVMARAIADELRGELEHAKVTIFGTAYSGISVTIGISTFMQSGQHSIGGDEVDGVVRAIIDASTDMLMLKYT